MEPGGKIVIRLAWDGAQIAHVEVIPRRSAEAAGLLRGKDGQQAVNLIPLLFSLCGKAQGVAGAMALEAAQGAVPGSETRQWRQRIVLAELVQESLWRFLLDVPKISGNQPMLAEYAELRRRVAGTLAPLLMADEWKTAGGRVNALAAADWQSLSEDIEAFVADKVLGMSLGDWCEMGSVAELENWLDAAPTSIVASLRQLWQGGGRWGGAVHRLLPTPEPDGVLARLVPHLEADPGFCISPLWHGEPAETGPLARLAGNRLLSILPRSEGASIFARMLARLLEVALVVRRSNAPERESSWLASAPVRPGVGAAAVQTARGLLIHWLRLQDGKVADYRIVAPTEWNFHPEGAYARGLTGRPAAAPDAVRAAAELLLLALDPCVAYQVEINDA